NPASRRRSRHRPKLAPPNPRPRSILAGRSSRVLQASLPYESLRNQSDSLPRINRIGQLKQERNLPMKRMATNPVERLVIRVIETPGQSRQISGRGYPPLAQCFLFV